jgi:putative hemolysin
MVVDEQGGFSGIVTLEDLVEELVGDIMSEHAEVSPIPITREPEGSALVQGGAAIRDVNRALGIELPESDAWTTLAGLCNALTGRIPTKGDRMVTSDGTEIEVVEATARRVRLVRLRPRKEEPPTPPTA